GRASRTNVLFSIPMLFFMGSASHLTIATHEAPNVHVDIGVVLILAALLEANIFVGNATTQKPLATVAGTIHAGLGLTLVLFVVASLLL
ncbi:MAG TPA: antitermination protein NusG, partial [Myxococcota bacterium]|nr:antitermination protein NusG [Myxococcota bacterium]